MKFLFTLLLSIATLPCAADAQQIAVLELFEYSSTGLFPPAGWSEANLNGSPNLGWEDPTVQPLSGNVLSLSEIAGHDDFTAGATNDFRLVGPSMDLTSFGVALLGFDSTLEFPDRMAHHPAQMGDGVSSVEISIDAGATWTVVWTETALISGGALVLVDLSAYAGQSNVRLGFRYTGTHAHAWGFDNVMVWDNAWPTGPELLRVGSCGQGNSGLAATNLTPNAEVGFAWSPQAGSSTLGFSPCNGALIGLLSPRVIGVVLANSSGNATIQPLGGIPSAACGNIFVQALDLSTCAPTNVLSL